MEPRSIRTQDIMHAAGTAAAARICGAVGCGRRTSESKPFCSVHVSDHPYVADLIARLQQQQQELQRVRKAGVPAVDLQGPVAEEILRHLEFAGPRSVRRLARDLSLDVEAVAAYVNALHRAGRLRIRRTARTERVALAPAA